MNKNRGKRIVSILISLVLFVPSLIPAGTGVYSYAGEMETDPEGAAVALEAGLDYGEESAFSKEESELETGSGETQGSQTELNEPGESESTEWEADEDKGEEQSQKQSEGNEGDSSGREDQSAEGQEHTADEQMNSLREGVFFDPSEGNFTDVDTYLELDVTAVEITDDEGTSIEDLEDVPRNTHIYVSYYFYIPEGAQSGDKAFIPLPSIIKLDDQELELDIYISGHEGEIAYRVLTATYNDEKHGLEIVFQEFVQSGISVNIYFYGTFDEFAIGEGGNQDIVLWTGADGKSYVFEVKFENGEVAFEKTGTLLEYDQEKDGLIVQWEFLIDPDSIAISNLVIQDKLPEGSVYIDGSAVFDPDDVGWGVLYEQGSNELIITAPKDVTYQEPVRVIILTLIENLWGLETTKEEGVEYFIVENEAVLDYIHNGEEKVLSDDDTVKFRPTVLFKGGEYNLDTRMIYWELTINQDLYRMKKAKLVDTLPPGLKLADIEIYELDIDDEGNWYEAEKIEDLDKFVDIEMEALENPEEGTRITFSFKDEIKKAYTIKYTTRVVINDFFDETNDVVFSNNAYLTWGDGPGPGFYVEIPVDAYSSMIRKYYESYDRDKRQIKWKIDVNENKNDLTDKKVKVVDYIDLKDQKYVEDSSEAYIIETDSSGQEIQRELKLDEDYWVNYDNATGELSITIDEILNEKQVVLYLKTEITNRTKLVSNGEKAAFKNEVSLFLNNDHITDDEAEFILTPNVLQKAVKEYDYAQRTISWILEINHDRLPADEVVIIEKLPPGLELDRVEVSEKEDGTYSVIDNIQVTKENAGEVTEYYVIEFSLDDIDETTRFVKVVTKIKDDFLDLMSKSNENVAFQNTARIRFPDVEHGDIIVKADAEYRHSIIEKTAEYDTYEENDIITWKVVFNSNALKIGKPDSDIDLSNVVLVDELQAGLMLDIDSIVLQRCELKADGTYEYMNSPVEVDNRNINCYFDNDGKCIFEFKFPTNLSDETVYELSFKTFVTKKGNYSNTITLGGYRSSLDEDSKINVTLEGAGGSAKLDERTDITIIKVDDDKKNVAKVQFALFDQNGYEIARSNVTSGNGRATFSNLRYDVVYTIVEIEAPERYIWAKDTKFRITKEGNIGDGTLKRKVKILEGDNAKLEYSQDDNDKYAEYEGTANITFKIENTLIRGNLVITKRDAQTRRLLSGAEFALMQDGIVIESGKTGLDGKLRFENIPYGNYTVIETGAPEGYNKSPDEWAVKVEKHKQTYRYTFTDTPTVVEIAKIDSKKDLIANSRAAFKLVRLYDDDDTEKYLRFSTLRNRWVETDSYLLAATVWTDSQGVLTLTHLPVGRYILKEVRAPGGYILNTDYLTFEVKENAGKDGWIEAVGTNAEGRLEYINYKGGARLKKVAGTTGEGLGGVKFALLSKEEYAVLDKSSVIAWGDIQGKVIRELISDSNGGVEVFDLEPGDYVLLEMETVKDSDQVPYKLNQFPLSFTIANKYSGNPGTIDLGEFQNFKETGQFTKVVQLEKEYALEGAEFEVYSVDTEGKATLVKIVESGNEGELDLTELDLGYYYLVETSAPVYHYGIDKKIYFVVESDGIYCDKFVIKNYQIEISFKKLDENSEKLKGAQFQLYKYIKDDPEHYERINDVVIQEIENGVFYAKGLPGTGKYRIVETSAPEGYYLNTDYLEFTVDDEPAFRKVIDLPDYINYKGAAQLKKVDESGSPIAGIEFTLYDITDRDNIEEIGKYITQSDGTVTATDLPVGRTYKFEETDAKGEYLINTADENLEFVIPDDAEAKGKPQIIVVGDRTLNNGSSNPDRTFTNYKGSVRVKKEDVHENPLKGAEFVIYKKDDQSVYQLLNGITAKSNDKGYAVFNDLSPGEYYIAEAKAPDGYMRDSEKIYEFEIEDRAYGKPDIIDETQTSQSKGVFINYSGRVVLRKKDEHNNPLKNAVFAIVKPGTEEIVTGVTGEKLIAKSDSNGWVVFSDVPAGTWIVMEIKAPKGYIMTKTGKEITIPHSVAGISKLTADGYYRYRVRESIYNYQGKVTLVKKNEVQEVLEGVMFDLYRYDKKSGEYAIYHSGYETDRSGKIEVDELPPGSYYFQESSSLADYILNTEEFRFEIPERADEKPEITLTDVINYKGEIELIKTDGTEQDDTKNKVSGAKYQLYREDSSGDQIVSYEDGEIKVTRVGKPKQTNEEGRILFKDLEPGWYYLKEIKAPEGYLINSDLIKVEVPKEYRSKFSETVHHTNYKAGIKIQKTDSGNHSLAGAAFELYNTDPYLSEDAVPLMSTKSGENGYVVFQNLVPGTYYLVEAEPPEGYFRNKAEVMEITIPERDTEVAASKDGYLYYPQSSNGAIAVIENYLVDVQFEKVNEKGEILASAKFTLYQLNEQGKEEMLRENITAEVTGIVSLENLKRGSYVLRESEAPNGYIRNTAAVKFEINDDTVQFSNSGEPLPLALEDFINYQGKVILRKENERQEGLANAVFSLFDRTESEPLATGLTTNEHGYLVYEGLPPGTYYFQEQAAPDGYMKNTTQIEFTISDEGNGEPKKVECLAVNYQGSVEFYKRNDRAEGLPGAEYSVYKNLNEDNEPIDLIPVINEKGDLVKSVSSDHTGRVCFSGIAPGSYYLREETAPVGYARESTIWSFQIAASNSGKPAEVIPDTLGDGQINYRGTVRFYKKDVYKRALSGAVFEIHDEGNNKVTFENRAGESVESVVSNRSGLVQAYGLEPGNYKFVEIKNNGRYILNTYELPFEIPEINKGPIELTLGDFINYQGAVELFKYDENSKLLPGAWFQLYREDTDGSEYLSAVGESVYDQNGLLIQGENQEPVRVRPIGNPKETGQDGSISYKELSPGTYYLKETAVPDGYILNTMVVKFTIKKETSGQPDIIRFDSYINYQGQVSFRKADEEGENRPDAAFNLYRITDDQKQISERTAEQMNPPESPIVSDENGVVSYKGLAPGNYYFEEVRAPQGYIKNLNKIEFEIPARAYGKPLIVEAAGGSFINYQGKIKINKVDKDGIAIPAPAVFGLYTDPLVQNPVKDESGNPITASTEQGTAWFEGLAPGNYYIQEITAPEGYIRSTKIYEAVIADQAEGDNRTKEITVKNYMGSVEFEKVNENGWKLSEAIFDLYQKYSKELLLEGIKSDSDGMIRVENLAPGAYYFVETEAPEGYIRNTNPHYFNIPEECEDVPDTHQLDAFVNYQAVVQIQKVSSSTEPVILSEARFSLYREEEGQYELVKEKIAPDQEGTITIANLSPGSYYLEETKALSGHIRNLEPIYFEISEASDGIDLQQNLGMYCNYQGSVRLTKYDESNVDTLAGAVFQLYAEADEGQSLLEPAERRYSWTDQEGNVIDDTLTVKIIGTSRVTGADGIIEYKNLAPGTYYLKETKAPTGYIRNTTIVKFTVEEEFVDEPPVKLFESYINYQGNVTFHKVEEKGEGLSGAEFDLYKVSQPEDIRINQAPIISDEEGNVSYDGLEPGRYYFRETKAPNGFIHSTEAFGYFTVRKNALGQPTVISVEEVENYKASVYFYKRNEEGKGLEGAEFVLFKKGNRLPLAQQIRSDAEGKVSISGLAPGEYRLKEITAPDGCLINDTPIKFTISDQISDSSELEVKLPDFINYKAQLKLLKLDGESDTGKQYLDHAEFILEKVASGLEEGLEAVGSGLIEVDPDFYQDAFTQQGEIIFTDLSPGYYRLSEKKAPDGYVRMKDYRYLEIPNHAAGQLVQLIEIENFKASVEFYKTDAQKPEEKLPGATFELYQKTDSENDLLIGGGMKSDESGRVFYDGLSPGSYYFKEVEAPAGYIRNTALIEFKIEEEAAENKLNKVLPDYPNYQFNVEFGKVDGDSAKALAGAQFNLYQKCGSDDDVLIAADIYSDSEGIVRYEGLAPGSYYFEEAEAPEGYLRNTVRLEFELEESCEGRPDDKILSEPFPNYTGSLWLKKIAEDGSLLSGAEFEVYEIRQPDKPVESMINKQGNKVSRLVSDENGEVFASGLAPGRYVLREIKAPDGYLINENETTFTIPEQWQGPPPVTIPDKAADGFTNYQASVRFKKTDAYGNAYTDAVFCLLKDGKEIAFADENGTLINEVSPDEEGYVTAYGLAPGEYQFAEMQNGAEYILNTEKLAFTVGETAAGKPRMLQIDDAFINYQGQMILTKYDGSSQEPLEGALFSLYLEDEKGEPLPVEGMSWTDQSGAEHQERPNVREVTEGYNRTDPQGMIRYERLQPGTYYLMEEEAPEGYIRNQIVTVFEIAQKSEGAVETLRYVSFTNYQGEISFYKTDESGNGLAGARFDLYREDLEEPVAMNLISGKDGLVSCGNLEPGAYYFLETQAPAGYIASGNKLLPFTIEKESIGTPAVLEAGSVMNRTVGVKFRKQDRAGNALEGAVFDLYKEGQLYQKGLKSSEDGDVIAAGLDSGSYYFEEVQAPWGYLRNEEKIVFTIGEDSASIPDVIDLEVNFINDQGSVRFVKTDGRTGDSLAGAEFSLYRVEETPELIAEGIRSTGNGVIEVNHLSPGRYYFAETKAPNGYAVNAEKFYFTIDESSDGEPEPVVLESFKNYQGSVMLVKTDEDGVRLADAEFRLEKKEARGNVVVEENLVTNEWGVITVNALEPGSYQFVETRAPEGYQLNREPVVFEIAGESLGVPEIISLVFENSPDEVESEQTDSDETDPGESDSDETDPDESDSDETDPDESDSDETDPGESDSDETDSDESDPNETDSDETDPDESDSDESDSDETDPDESDSDETDSGESDSDETDPDESDSDETDSDEGDSDETDPDESDSDETDPDESDSDESDSDETDPDESDPNETDTDESDSDETDSDESDSDETNPNESDSDETNSNESDSDETNSSESDPNIDKPWETDPNQPGGRELETPGPDSPKPGDSDGTEDSSKPGNSKGADDSQEPGNPDTEPAQISGPDESSVRRRTPNTGDPFDTFKWWSMCLSFGIAAVLWKNKRSANKQG